MDSGSGRSSPYLTIAAVTAAVGLAAYAVYFDYKRRNDVDFRKKLSKSIFPWLVVLYRTNAADI